MFNCCPFFDLMKLYCSYISKEEYCWEDMLKILTLFRLAQDLGATT